MSLLNKNYKNKKIFGNFLYLAKNNRSNLNLLKPVYHILEQCVKILDLTNDYFRSHKKICCVNDVLTHGSGVN